MQQQIEHQLKQATAQVRTAYRERDQLMAEAARSGMSLRSIASVVGLSFGRVGQIVRGETKHGNGANSG
jgi:hypothetical protein